MSCSPSCLGGCAHCRCEGERRKADAFAVLTANREAVIRRAQRALLVALLDNGSATADDIRELVDLPSGVNPKCFGPVPLALARAGVIRADGYAKTCRPVGHARPVTVWRLADRGKALRWLADHPELPGVLDKSEGVAVDRQGMLFAQETATPAAGTVGAADSIL